MPTIAHKRDNMSFSPPLYRQKEHVEVGVKNVDS